MAVPNYKYLLDIRTSTGAPRTGLSLVQLRAGASSYAFTEIGTGIYSIASIPAGRYTLWINNVSTGQSYGVGEGELAGLGYSSGSKLKSTSNALQWAADAGNVATALQQSAGAPVGITEAGVYYDTLTNRPMYNDGTANEEIGSNLDHLDLDINPVAGPALGRIRWTPSDYTAGIGLGGDVEINIGEGYVACYNGTGYTIPNGAVVCITGSQGQRQKIELAGLSTGFDPRLTIGMATADIPSGTVGPVTTSGIVRGIDTSAFTEGAFVYLGSYGGSLSSVKPSGGVRAIRVGVVTKSNAGNGAIFVSVHDETEYLFTESVELAKGYTGFVDGDNIAVSYNSTNRTVTLTGNLTYLWQGKYKQLSSPWTSAAHTTTTGKWFLYSTDGTNFTWSQTQWLFEHAMAAFVFYGASDKFGVHETHNASMSHHTHANLHETTGTYKRSGGTLTAGTFAITPASPTDADNTPGIDAVTLCDEDHTTVVTALTQGSYTRAYGNASGTTVFTKASATIVPIGATYPQYNNNGTLTEMANGEAMNVYVYAVPTTSDAGSLAYRFLFVPGSAKYSTAALAALEPLAANIGDFASPEYCAIARITISTNASYTSTGKFRIERVDYLTGSRVEILGPGSIISDPDKVSKSATTAQVMVGPLESQNTNVPLRGRRLSSQTNSQAGGFNAIHETDQTSMVGLGSGLNCYVRDNTTTADIFVGGVYVRRNTTGDLDTSANRASYAEIRLINASGSEFAAFTVQNDGRVSCATSPLTGDNSLQLATTAFIRALLADFDLYGALKSQKPADGDISTLVATTNWAQPRIITKVVAGNVTAANGESLFYVNVDTNVTIDIDNCPSGVACKVLSRFANRSVTLSSSFTRDWYHGTTVVAGGTAFTITASSNAKNLEFVRSGNNVFLSGY